MVKEGSKEFRRLVKSLEGWNKGFRRGVKGLGGE